MPTPAPTSIPFPSLTSAANVPSEMQAMADRLHAYYPRGLVVPPLIITANTADVEAETLVWSPMTVALFSDRRYEVLVHGAFPIHSVDGIRSSLRVRYAAGTSVAVTSTSLASGKSRAQGHTIHVVGYITGLAGQHTFGFGLARELGAAGNTVRINSSTTEPSSVSIKDVGPA